MTLRATRGIHRLTIPDPARHHADHIAIDHRDRGIEGKGGHCPGRVGTDPGQFFQFRHRGWKFSAMVPDHRFCHPQQIAGAGVITESFPQTKHFRFLDRRESRRIRKSIHPAVVIPAIEHGLDTRLLQHHLADEDGIRVGGLPPRVIAGLIAEPVQQRAYRGGRGRLHPRIRARASVPTSRQARIGPSWVAVMAWSRARNSTSPASLPASMPTRARPTRSPVLA
jgi:hypothetical protein